MQHKLTIKQAKQIVSNLGLVLKRNAEFNEFSVNFRGGNEVTAYYTNDIYDAVATARVMAANTTSGHWCKNWSIVEIEVEMHK